MNIHCFFQTRQITRGHASPPRRHAYPRFAGVLILLLAAASHVATAAGSNPIQQENSLPGTPNWDGFASDLGPDTISGFGSKISVNHGDSLDFYVTTTAPSFTIDIFRTGYYQGIGARLVQPLGSFTGLHQAIPAPDRVTGIIACTNWTKTTTLQIPATWVTGVYLAKLTSSTGYSSFIFFVVRDDGGTEDLVFQTSVTTYQAYNTWGGTSLYNNLTNMSVYPYAHATKVSFDRPFNPGDSNGAGHYLFYEYKFVYWLESLGYNVTYTTDVDTDLRTPALTNHKGFLSVGHDEYWSLAMRNNVQNAINSGVNVAFFSANTMYWQIRFEPNAAGLPDRIEVGYKDFATDTTPPGPDPQWGVNNAIVTTNWRDPTVNEPENGVMGVMFEQQTDNSYAYVIQDANSWIYDNTGFVEGSSVRGIVGYEYDKVWDNGFTPAGLTVLSNSPVHGCCGGFSSDANSTIYTAPSGARVFAAGTIQWSWGLANVEGNTFANAGIQQTTANILNNFIFGPTPNAGLSTTSLSFNGGVIGRTSATQTITLTSNGTADLNVSSITLTGANPGDFAETNNCPSAMGINVSCTIHVTFTPTSVGNRSASVALTDNAANSPQSIPLSGIGQATAAPLVSLNPGSLTFGYQSLGTISAAQSVTLTNIGTAPLSISSIASTGADPSDFIPTSSCPSGANTLAVNASCTVSVTFSPTLSGTRSATVAVTDNAFDSPEGISLTGTAITPTIYFQDGFESGNFSQWNLPSGDSSGQRSVETSVINNGVYAAAFTVGSGQYAYLYTALPGGPQAQTFTRFYFQVTNAANGTILAVARNANGGNTWEADYNGTHQRLDFYFWNSSGGLSSFSSANQTITANTWYCLEIQDTQTNAGQAQAWLNGTSIGSVSADLSNANPFARLMLYDSAVGTIYFDDVIVGNVYNGPVVPTPAVSVSPAGLNFGNQAVNTPGSKQTLTVVNRGRAVLNIASFSISGANAADFTVDTSECPLTLAANASCTLDVTFTAGALGSRSASLLIADNAPNSPQVVPLSGAGINPGPAVTLSPGSLTYGYQILSTTSPLQTITLLSNGTVPLSIGSITLTGTNTTDFAETSNCPSAPNTLAVNAFCTISVTFTPTANGTRSASVTIADNVSGSPQSVSLTGTGLTANLYLKDGFESGDFSQWNLPSSDSTGQRTVQSSVVNTGTFASAFTNSSGQYAYIYTALPDGPQSQTFTRFYFRLSSTAGGTILAEGRNANGGNTWEVDYNSGRQGLDLYFWNSAGGVYTFSSPMQAITADTWYCLEIQDTQTSTGQAQAWLNGASIGSVRADLSNANPFARLLLFDGAIGTCYFDDVVVSNVYNGPVAPTQTTTTLVTADVNPSSYGQTVTLSATVNSGAGAPTGSVAFLDGASTLGIVTLANGAVQLPVSSLGAGAHSITAKYSGDGTFFGSTSAVLTETINRLATTTTLTSSLNPATFGQAVTLTAAVQAGSGSAVTGTVTFLDGSATLGTGTLGSNSAQLTTATLAPGSHTLTAVYGGAANFNGSTSAVVTETISQLTTTITLAASVNPATAGQSVTLTATIQAGAGNSAAGTVTFLDGSTTLGSTTVSSNSAQFTTSALAAGAHSITAVYGGDTNFAGSTSALLTETINQAATTTILTSNVNPATAGQGVTFTATIQAGGGNSAAGTVTFLDGSTTLGTATVSNNSAQLATSALAAGSHAITAVYGGAPNFAGSTSAVLTETINPMATTTTLTSSMNPSLAGQAVTLTASVQAGAGNSAIGTVNFMDGSSLLGTVTVANNSAQLTVSTLSAGTHTITAAYSGGTNFSASTSPALTQTVNPSSTTTALVSNLNPATFGQAVPFVARLQTASGGTATGTVTFFDGSTSLGIASLLNNTAQLTVSGLLGGTHTITAAYGGDANYTASTSLALTQTINPAGSATTVAAGPSPASFGQAVTLTATVVPSVTGSLATGTVTFLDGTTTLGSASLSNNVAQISVGSFAAGSHSITAKYAGDRNFAASVSTAVSETVNPAATSTALTSSANPSLVKTSVTFTAKVSSAVAGTQSGTVSFYLDGSSTAAASVAVSNGTANYATSSLSAGSHSVVAVFSSSNANFAGSTSPTLTHAVSDFSLAISPSSLTVARRTSGTYTLIVTSLGAFSGNVLLSCSGAPSGTTCAISPTQVTLNGSGSAQATATITVGASTSTGTRTLTFTGTSGTLTHKVTTSLTIN